MIHEVRNLILRSIDLLPYSVYMSSILAADSEKERNIRTNYQSYIDIFKIIKDLVSEKKKGSKSASISKLLNYNIDFKVQRIVDTNTFENAVTNSINDLLHTWTFEQIQNENILHCLLLADSIIQPDAIEDIKRALEELRTQLTSEGIRTYIANKLKTDVNNERISFVIQDVTSAIADTTLGLNTDITDIKDQIDAVLSELLDQKPGQNSRQLDNDIRQQIYDKTGLNTDRAIQEIQRIITDLLSKIPDFSQNDIINLPEDKHKDYSNLITLIEKLGKSEIKEKDQLKSLYEFFNGTFKTDTFAQWLTDIGGMIQNCYSDANAKEGPRYRTKIPTNICFKLSGTDEGALERFNKAVTDAVLPMDFGKSISKIILGCIIGSQLVLIFSDAKVIQTLADNGEEPQGEGSNNKLSFSVGTYFELKNNSVVRRKNRSLRPPQQFVYRILDTVWRRIPYNILDRQLNEAVGTYNGVMYNTTETKNGNVLDKNSADLFDELQAPEDFKDSISMKLAEWWHKNDKDKEGKAITPEEMYRRTLITKRALGLMGKWTLNFGRMALFFINNGGYASYQQCCRFLAGLPAEYTKNSLIRPEEAKEIYRMIDRQDKYKNAYKLLEKYGPKYAKSVFFKSLIDNKDDDKLLKSIIESYHLLITNPKTLNVFARISKPTARTKTGFHFRSFLSRITSNEIKETLSFIDLLYKNTRNAREEIANYYSDTGKFGRYAESGMTDPPSKILMRLLQLVSMGKTCEASSFDVDYYDIRNIIQRGGYRTADEIRS